MEESIRTLERRSFTAWPALHTLEEDGWVLRSGDGYTRRANSANAIASSQAAPGDQIARIEAHYRARDLPPIFRVTPLADPAIDGELAARGYLHADPCVVMVAKPGHPKTDPQIVEAADPWSGWLDAFIATAQAPALVRSQLGAVLRGLKSPALFARIDDAADIPAAFAMGVVEDGYVGIFEVLCAPNARRQGYGKRAVAHAMAWGFAQGAHTAYLQVALDNAPALPLYANLGFVPLYGYHYRIGEKKTAVGAKPTAAV